MFFFFSIRHASTVRDEGHLDYFHFHSDFSSQFPYYFIYFLISYLMGISNNS